VSQIMPLRTAASRLKGALMKLFLQVPEAPVRCASGYFS